MLNKENNPLVSIIIPIYKVEKYLHKCIDSALSQTYKNIEVILVDDGSPDNCPKICDDYTKQNSRVKVIHKTNGGLSDARNKGLEIAVGEYIMFVDSDDYISEDAVECLLRAALDTDADITIAGCYSIEDKTDKLLNSICYTFETLTKYKAAERFSNKDWGAWAKLYKAEVHRGIEFPYGCIHEDEAIMFQLIDRCNVICTIPDIIYYYLQRNDSITSIAYSVKKMDWFYAWKNNVLYVEKNYRNALPKVLGKAWDVTLYNLENLVGNNEYISYINIIREFIKTYKFKILFNPQISINKKLRLIIAEFSDLNSSKCLYIKIYSSLNKLRSK